MPTQTTYTATPKHSDAALAGVQSLSGCELLLAARSFSNESIGHYGTIAKDGIVLAHIVDTVSGRAMAESIVVALNSHAQLMASLDALLDAISDLSDAARAELAGANDDAVSQAIAALAMARKGGQ